MRVRWLIPFGTVAAAMAPAAYATQYLSVAQAQRAAFPQATEFAATAPPDAAAVAALGAPAGWTPQIFAARNGDVLQGWLIVDQVLGKSEFITYALALDARGAVISVDVLDYRESHGGEIRLAGWRRQFAGKTAADAAALPGQIKNISGATLSCRHLTDGVQRLLRLHDAVLKARAG
jgi:electron transport complex protein RnfG